MEELEASLGGDMKKVVAMLKEEAIQWTKTNAGE